MYIKVLFFLFLNNHVIGLNKSPINSFSADVTCILKIYTSIDSFILAKSSEEFYNVNKENIKIKYKVTFNDDNTLKEVDIIKISALNIEADSIRNYLLTVNHSCLRQSGIIEYDTLDKFIVPYSYKTLQKLKKE